MKKVSILYVEDDNTLGYLTTDNLKLRGFDVIHCKDGREALIQFNAQSFDLCILDIMLPSMDGFELAAEIRKINQQVPILFLTAKTLTEDKIKGLQIGADDYIVKPFNVEELVLKINVFLKRSQINTADDALYTKGYFRFDYSNLELTTRSGTKILTQKEGDLLKLFLDNQGKLLKREFILKTLWGDDDYFLGRSLDVFIFRLRKHLSEQQFYTIENVHGIGFKMHINQK